MWIYIPASVVVVCGSGVFTHISKASVNALVNTLRTMASSEQRLHQTSLAFLNIRLLYVYKEHLHHRWSQWPRGLRHRSAAARQLRLWVRIPRGAWMFICCECCVMSGRGLCDELITRPEESYRLCDASSCVIWKPQEWEGRDPCRVAAPQGGVMPL